MENIEEDIKFTIERCEKRKIEYEQTIQELELELAREITIQHVSQNRWEAVEKACEKLRKKIEEEEQAIVAKAQRVSHIPILI